MEGSCLLLERLITRPHLPVASPMLYLLSSRYSRRPRSDTMMVNVRDTRCLLPVALRCLRCRNIWKKHGSAQREVSAQCACMPAQS
jgi:hypothetical protein